MENSSGQGKAAAIPDEIRGWSWGAFLLNWVWGLFNRTWIALGVLIPVVGFVVWILLGLKGNEWAWRNKRWDDVDHFKRVQRKWAIAGLILLLLPIVAIAVAVFVLGVSLDSLDDAPAAKAPPAVSKAPAPKAPAPPPPPSPAAAPKAPVQAAPATAPTPSQPAVTAGAAAKAAGATESARIPAAVPEPADAKPSSAPSEKVTATTVEAPRRAPARKRSAPAPAPLPAVEAAVAPARAPFATPRYNDIMSAVVSGDEAGVRETIAFGMFVDRRDSNGLTPLMVASMRRNIGMARMLLEAGANPHLVAGGGQSAMWFARDNGDTGMAALLRRYGVPEK